MLAQDYPESHPELLIGKELKVKPTEESLHEYGFDGFYKDENLKKIYACCDKHNSKYSEMVNKVFKVLEVIPYVDAIHNPKLKLKMQKQV